MSFLMLLVFVAFYIIRPQDFWPPLQGERVVFLTLLLASSVWAIQVLFTRKRVFRYPQCIFILGLWAACIASTYTARWQWYTLNTFIVFGKATLVYYLITDIVNSPKKLKIFMWVLVLSCAVIAVFGILQYYGIDVTNLGAREAIVMKNGFGMVKIVRVRGAGIFDTNQLAHTMGLMLPLAGALFFTSRVFMARLALIGVMGAFGLCALYTESRGGIMTFALSSVLLMGTRGRRLGGRFLAIVAAGFVVFLLVGGTGRFSTAIDYKEDKSAMARLEISYIAREYFLRYPITGIGVNQFSEYEKMSTHNRIAQAAAETGLLGMFFWTGLMFFSLKTLLSIQKEAGSGEDKTARMVTYARCLTICFVQFTASCFFVNDPFIFTFFIMISLVAAMLGVSRNSGIVPYEPPPPGTPLISRQEMAQAAGFTLGVLLLWQMSLKLFL